MAQKVDSKWSLHRPTVGATLRSISNCSPVVGGSMTETQLNGTSDFDS